MGFSSVMTFGCCFVVRGACVAVCVADVVAGVAVDVAVDVAATTTPSRTTRKEREAEEKILSRRRRRIFGHTAETAPAADRPIDRSTD